MRKKGEKTVATWIQTPWSQLVVCLCYPSIELFCSQHLDHRASECSSWELSSCPSRPPLRPQATAYQQQQKPKEPHVECFPISMELKCRDEQQRACRSRWRDSGSCTTKASSNCLPSSTPHANTTTQLPMCLIMMRETHSLCWFLDSCWKSITTTLGSQTMQAVKPTPTLSLSSSRKGSRWGDLQSSAESQTRKPYQWQIPPTHKTPTAEAVVSEG